ncbi:MAG TPA: DUF3011 domain-containing protein, partial [Vicinamibacterales bacterium]|nr:DUF3011 domain-containing protein [Vicinamibacterales bacterium]
MVLLLSAGTAHAQTRVSCASTAGERQHCDADTSAGVVLASSTGSAACLLGKTWGYDDTGVWVADGCVAEFVTGATAADEEAKKEKRKP